jgi:ABC-type nitrate/sulfonate/bicarbonate transport system ATPase subunit
MNDTPVSRKPAVVLRDLRLTFPEARGAEPVHVLDGLHLTVEEGEFVCLVGPSGCGKTTLLNIVAGFLEASGGEVLVEGEPVHGPDPRRIFIFQEGGVFPWLTVRDNVGFGLARHSRAERERTVRHYIDMVGLTGFEGSYPRELSGGMRQRVEIARALAANPEVVYMDEPFGALDYFTRLKMRADLVKIWEQERKTVLFVTHDIDEAVQLAERVVVLSRRPATVQLIVPVDLPRPRDPDSAGYLQTRAQIVSAMGISLRDGVELDGDAARDTASPPTPLRSGQGWGGRTSDGGT